MSGATYIHRGFAICTRKKTKVERYYAWVYRLDQTSGGVRMPDYNDDFGSRADILAHAKREIDSMFEEPSSAADESKGMK